MLDKLFSIKEVDLHYIVKFCGVKFKIMNSKKAFAELKKIRQQMKRSQIPTIYNTNLTQEQKIWFLSQKFYEEVGYYPDFKNPKSFNEKINWMKLNYYNPLEDVCIDKYTFKEYIRAKLGAEYVIPAIGVYEDVNDIDFNKLPQKFVIKTTIGNGGIGCQLVKDKNKINIDKLKYTFNNLMQEWNSPFFQSYQPGFKYIQPKIIIEEYMPIREGAALEYKMFCFHGEMKFCLIECDYFGKKPARAIYDKQFQELPFTIRRLTKRTLNKKPQLYDEMIVLAEKLAATFPFVRVDFYVINNKIYLSELTFNSGAGFSVFTPTEWDYKLGEWLDLTKLNPKYVCILEEFKNTDLGNFYNMGAL